MHAARDATAMQPQLELLRFGLGDARLYQGSCHVN